MKSSAFFILILIVFTACKQKKDVKIENVSMVSHFPDYKIEFGKVSKTSVFKSDVMSIWGGSLVKGDDEIYHMDYSRWPKKIGWEWVNYSEIAHATSNSPFGPFKFRDVAATSLDIAKIEVPAYMHGKVFLGEKTSKRKYIFGFRQRAGDAVEDMRSISYGKHKLIWNRIFDRP